MNAFYVVTSLMHEAEGFVLLLHECTVQICGVFAICCQQTFLSIQTEKRCILEVKVDSPRKVCSLFYSFLDPWTLMVTIFWVNLPFFVHTQPLYSLQGNPSSIEVFQDISASNSQHYAEVEQTLLVIEALSICLRSWRWKMNIHRQRSQTDGIDDAWSKSHTPKTYPFSGNVNSLR